MPQKVQSQLLVSRLTRQRADALAVVRGEPRAEVYRIALEGAGLPGLESQHAQALLELQGHASRIGMDAGQLAEWMARDGYTLADARKWLSSYPHTGA